MNASENSLTSVIEYFYHWERETPDNVFLRQPSGSRWQTYTFAQAGQEARKILTALKGMGLSPGDHIGIYSKNCAHWVMADLAIMMGGFVSVPFYASLPRQQLQEVIHLSDIKCLFIGRQENWGDKADAVPPEVAVIRLPHIQGDAEVPIGADWAELVNANEPDTGNFVPSLDDLWTIKFTSGTTGTPKGVMHIHRTPALIMANEKKTGWIGLYDLPEARFMSFLPLNHVGERMGVEVPCIVMGGTMSFVEKLETFAANIQDTQPTMFFAVPRIWTKFYLGVLAKIPEQKLNRLLKLPIVSGMIRKKLRTAMGMRDVKVAATGAAITPAFIKEFYKKLGIHLIEAYGMTEVCGSMTNGPDPQSPPDSVGKAVPFGAVKIDEESGEILMQSPYMMTGYYKNPEKTAEVLVDGWLHSGDRGSLDEQGYLRVTGRVKDAFKTAKGSYVTPNPLEEVIAENDYVEQVCVVGLAVPQPLALINLSEMGISDDREQVADSIQASIEALNKTRANFERISTAVIHETAWSEHNGLLTPTLKVKRGEIDNQFGSRYLEWHESDQKVIWSS